MCKELEQIQEVPGGKSDHLDMDFKTHWLTQTKESKSFASQLCNGRWEIKPSIFRSRLSFKESYDIYDKETSF